MQTVTTLVNIAPTTLLAWLNELANSANADPMLSPYHPPSTPPIPLYVDPSFRPVYVRQHSTHVCGLYASRPLTGELLLLLCAEPLGDSALRVFAWCSDQILVGAATLRHLLTSRFDQPLPTEIDAVPVSSVESSALTVTTEAPQPACYEWLATLIPDALDLFGSDHAAVGSLVCPYSQSPGHAKQKVVSQLSPDAWLAAAMAHMPDPYAHGHAPANDETAEGDPAPDAPTYSTEEWLALAMAHLPDPLTHGNFLRLMLSPTGSNPRAQRTTRLTSEQWLAAAMRRLPDPRDHTRLVEAWLRRCQQLDARARALRSPGAPVHSCNQWLEEALAGLLNPSDNAHLYDEWLDHYKEEHGAASRDPRRGFVQAVDGCLTRLKERAASAQLVR